MSNYSEKPEPKTWATVTILVAVIGCISVLGAALITALPDILNPPQNVSAPEITPPAPISSPSQIVGETSPQSTTDQQIIALSDKFDGSAGSYDTNLWACNDECSIDNLFLKNGELNLQRSNQGVTSITSRSKWAYSDLASLTGKFLISNNLNQGEIGWLSFADNVAGCGIYGTEDPYILCDIGPYVAGKHEYSTDRMPIKFNTWYSIKYEFGQNSNDIRFYLDNILLGEYTLANHPDKVQVASGIYIPDNITSYGQVYIDDVLLTLNR